MSTAQLGNQIEELLKELFPPPISMEYEPIKCLFLPHSPTSAVSSGIILKDFMNKHDPALQRWFGQNKFEMVKSDDKIVESIQKYLPIHMGHLLIFLSSLSLEQKNYLARLYEKYIIYTPKLEPTKDIDYEAIMLSVKHIITCIEKSS